MNDIKLYINSFFTADTKRKKKVIENTFIFIPKIKKLPLKGECRKGFDAKTSYVKF